MRDLSIGQLVNVTRPHRPHKGRTTYRAKIEQFSPAGCYVRVRPVEGETDVGTGRARWVTPAVIGTLLVEAGKDSANG